MVVIAPYLPVPGSGDGTGGTGNAPLELLALEPSLLLSPLPPPRSRRSCRFVNRFQNESLPFGFFFTVSPPYQRLPSLDEVGGHIRWPGWFVRYRPPPVAGLLVRGGAAGVPPPELLALELSLLLPPASPPRNKRS